MPIGSLGLGICFHIRIFFEGAEAPALFQINTFYLILKLKFLRFFKYYIYLELRKSFSFSLLKDLAVGGAVEGAVADGFGDVAA